MALLWMNHFELQKKCTMVQCRGTSFSSVVVGSMDTYIYTRHCTHDLLFSNCLWYGTIELKLPKHEMTPMTPKWVWVNELSWVEFCAFGKWVELSRVILFFRMTRVELTPCRLANESSWVESFPQTTWVWVGVIEFDTDGSLLPRQSRDV